MYCAVKREHMIDINFYDCYTFIWFHRFCNLKSSFFCECPNKLDIAQRSLKIFIIIVKKYLTFFYVEIHEKTFKFSYHQVDIPVNFKIKSNMVLAKILLKNLFGHKNLNLKI